MVKECVPPEVKDTMLSSYIIHPQDHPLTNNPPTQVRVCVCGGYDVGKSAVTVRFLTRRFIGEYQKNVQLSYGGSIQFGPDVINFELKDTPPNTDLNFLTTWPNCLAIIYSIIDHTSFDMASKILNYVDSTLRRTLDYTSRSLPLVLIANKNDLGHFRRVSEEEGRNLALKYGASFWETSAYDDYYSVFRPLHSLVVETFLSNSSLWYPSDANDQTLTKSETLIPSNDYSPYERRRTESPTPNNPRRKITPTLSISPVEEVEIPEMGDQPNEGSSNFFNFHSPPSPPQYPAINQLQRKQSDDTTGSKSSPILSGLNALKRKRSLFKQKKSFSLDSKDTISNSRYLSGICSASASSTPPSTPPSGENTPSNATTVMPSFRAGSSITINIQEEGDTGDLLTPTRYCGGLSKSFSKADRKNRLQPTTSLEQKRLTRQASMNQSHSCTDLKTLQTGFLSSPYLAVRSNVARDTQSLSPSNFRKDIRRRSSSPEYGDQDYSRSSNSSPTYQPRQFSAYGQEGGEVSDGGKRKSVKKKITSMLRAFSQTSINQD